jgi:hypothetical protein
MVQDNIPAVGAAGYTLLSELDDLTWDSWLSLADVATAMNTKAASQGAIFANGFTNTYLEYSGVALIFNHANLTAANAAAICNEAGFTTANKALVFNEAGFTVPNKALVFNEAGFTTANKALVFNEAGFTVPNKALVFNEAGFTPANKALVFNEAGFTVPNKALVFNEAGFTPANKALVFNEAGFTVPNKALVFNEAGFTVPNKALVFNEAGFTPANKALVFREAGLSIANINAIIIHANITDDNAQQILSEITKANRDLTSAANIYEILDDWDDNKLTGRDGAGTTSTGFTNLFAHKALFRPVWTTATGTPSATGGVMVLPVGNTTTQHVTTPSSFVVGTWEIDYKWVADPNAGDMFFYAMSDAISVIVSESGYSYYQSANHNRHIYRVDAGAAVNILGSGAGDPGTTVKTVKMTRDASGNWELFYEGGSIGTVLDNTHTSTTYIQIANRLNTETNWDNLKVY